MHRNPIDFTRRKRFPSEALGRRFALYTAEDVDRARGSIKIDYTLANLGARRLWDLITTKIT